MLVGTVGHETLTERMRWWQIRAALRGKQRDARVYWETSRLHAFVVAKLLGSEAEKAQDLFSLPWEKSAQDIPSDDEIEELKRMMADENRRIEN